MSASLAAEKVPMQSAIAEPRPSVDLSASFHFAWSVREILARHPDNEKLWNDSARAQQAILFHVEALENVFEKSPPLGVRYCYFALTESSGRLLAWMPGYVAQNQAKIHYGRRGANRIGVWVLRQLRRFEAFRRRFPDSMATRDLMIGHDMDYGRIYRTNDRLSEVQVFEELLTHIDSLRQREAFDSVMVMNLKPALASVLQPFMQARGYLRREGDGFAAIDLEALPDLGAYLEKITGQENCGRNDVRKLLKGNFIPEELRSYLKTKRKGFPEYRPGGSLGGVREKAQIISRRQQTREWLESNGLAGLMPKSESGEERARFLDRAAGVLLQDGWVADLCYEFYRATPELIEAVFPLWETQNRKYGMDKAYVPKEWFLHMEKLSEGVCFLQVCFWADQPAAFYFIYLKDDIFYSMFCGYDPFLQHAHHLYFTMHAKEFIEAKKCGAKTLALGPGNYRMNEAKRKIGAHIDRTVSFVHQDGFRLPFHRPWMRLRWALRRFKIRIGGFEFVTDGQILPPLASEAAAGEPAWTPPEDLLQKLRALSAEDQAHA